MRKRRTDDTQPMAPIKRDDGRLRIRREVLRNLQVTELKVVVGGANCKTSIVWPE